jgi:hypothetical protein
MGNGRSALRPLLKKLTLASVALCVVVVTVRAIALRGFGFGALAVAVQSLEANLFDGVAVVANSLNFHWGWSSRPTEYALICELPGVLTEAENAAKEKQIRSQLQYQSGSAYNPMMAQMRDGYPHPSFILSPNSEWGAELCVAKSIQDQECTCAGRVPGDGRYVQWLRRVRPLRLRSGWQA